VPENVEITTLSSTVVYANAWLSVREDKIERRDGSHGLYSVIDQRDFSLVIPFENNGFHLVEQFRYPIGARSWEFPAGSLPSGVSGSPQDTAAAELAEETGYTAGRWEELGYIHCSTGTSSQGAHVFLATDLTAGQPRREPTEQDMCHRWFSGAEVEDMMRTGVITDGPSLAGYLLMKLHG